MVNSKAPHPFILNPSLRADDLGARFRERGRLEIKDLLKEGQAETLRRHLLARDDWALVMNAGDKVYELPRRKLGELSRDQLQALDDRLAASARHGFQYRYETIRVPDADEQRTKSADALSNFVRFMSSQPLLDLMERILGEDGLAFADGQATAYSAGHFLTRHDDDVEGKHRRAAYVFGLSPGWRAEWGGLLMFHGEDGNVDEAFTPAMGALRLFSVPVSHSVSYVTPFAPEPRLAVTGWLRSRPPET